MAGTTSYQVYALPAATFAINGIEVPAYMTGFQLRKQMAPFFFWFMDASFGPTQLNMSKKRGGFIAMRGLVAKDQLQDLLALLNTGPFTVTIGAYTFNSVETVSATSTKNSGLFVIAFDVVLMYKRACDAVS